MWTADEFHPPLAAPLLDGMRTPPPLSCSATQFDRWVREQEKVWAEWDDGRILVFEPPTVAHNDVAVWLLRLFFAHVESRGDRGVVSFHNLICLPNLRRKRLPDLYYLRPDRRHLLGERSIDGSPDLVIEIVSEDDPDHDYVTKFREYEAAGVAEYWIADPQNKHLSGWHLVDATYQPLERSNDQGGKVFSRVLPGLWLRQRDLFADPRPTVAAVLAEVEAGAPTQPAGDGGVKEA